MKKFMCIVEITCIYFLKLTLTKFTYNKQNKISKCLSIVYNTYKILTYIRTGVCVNTTSTILDISYITKNNLKPMHYSSKYYENKNQQYCY